MTARSLYEAVLIELNKENAPNILLESFNYFANKAINNYINKRYNIYDINQQTSDDLRVLKSTATLDATHLDVSDEEALTSLGGNNMATYYVYLPMDYLHILNCICIYELKKTFKCYNKGQYWRAAATRLTADMYSQVLDNFWNKPDYKKPYYYIHNVNYQQVIPTDPVVSTVNPAGVDGSFYSSDPDNNVALGTDGNNNNIYTGDNSKTIDISIPSYNSSTHEVDITPVAVSNVERGAVMRYGNMSPVRMEIRYGTDNTVFELKKVKVDYIKAPQNIRLTQYEIDKTEDVSQMLEYPDYVCQEIVNELVHLIMENISDQRLQTHPVVSQSIANPAQQQTEPVAQQQPT